MNNKSTKNLILSGLMVLALAVALAPMSASAYVTKGAYQVGEGGQTFAPKSESQNNNTSAPVCEKPIISSISPSSAVINSGAKSITINGSCFTPSSVAKWNGANRPTTFVDSKKIVMQTTANDIGATGKFPVTVFEPTVNKTSNSVNFTVTGKTVAKASTSKPKAVVAKAEVDECEPQATLASVDEESGIEGDVGLSANALAGFLSSDGFLPDTLLGWIFLFIFILLAIKLWRKIMESEKERNAPLKHA